MTDQVIESGTQTLSYSGCEDKRYREITILEAPCPLCGAEQEIFSDELLKESLRCRSCGKNFTPEAFKKSAGL